MRKYVNAERKSKEDKSLISNNQSKQPQTVPQKNTYTIQEIDELIEQGKRLPFNFPFQNLEEVAKRILFLSSSQKGYELLLKLGFDVPKASYGVFINPDTNPHQRARCVYDIARYSIIPHMMIGFKGNTPLPKELQNWQPIFGSKWFIQSMSQIKDSDMLGNIYWLEQAELLYADYIKMKEKPRVKDLTLELIDNRSLLIQREGKDAVITDFNKLSVF